MEDPDLMEDVRNFTQDLWNFMEPVRRVSRPAIMETTAVLGSLPVVVI